MNTTAPRSNVTIDDRRALAPLAAKRKPWEVASEKHEDFIRRQLKTRLGWAPRDPAPESIKAAAKQMAASLVARDKAAAEAKAAAERELEKQVANAE